MNIIKHPSPNFDSRDGHPVDMLVMHYTGMKTAKEALEKLCDGNAPKKVSSHYLVDEDGAIYQLVDESARAWHAGASYWRGATNINQRSIGIEIVNPGHESGYRPFPKAQMEAVANLSKEIIARHNIPSWNVVAHSDIAPERKSDPGELFDWCYLAQQGIGTAPSTEKTPLLTLIEAPMKWVTRLFSSSQTTLHPGDSGPKVADMQARLAEYGYNIEINGKFDKQTEQVVIAFKRHFRPSPQPTAEWRQGCVDALSDLLKRAPAATISRPDSRMAALSGVRNQGAAGRE